MSTEDDLWRRVLAAGYDWAPGMLAVWWASTPRPGGRKTHRVERRSPPPYTGKEIPIAGFSRMPTPDWTEDATLGCLCGMARAALAEPLLVATPYKADNGSVRWSARTWAQRFSDDCATEAEALLKALLAGKKTLDAP